MNDQDKTAAAKGKGIPGLVLVDIPNLDLKCGEYVTLSEADAKACAGQFDPKAPKPVQSAADE